MGMTPTEREATMAAAQAGAQATRTMDTRRATVISVDPTNRVAVVQAVGPDGGPFGALVAAPVTLWPGDVVQVLFVQPHGALILGRMHGDWDAWHTVGQDGEPPFGTGWGAEGTTTVPGYDGPPVPAFTHRSGRVELRGWAERSSGTNDTVFQLPEQYRPENDLLIPALGAVGAHTVVTVDRSSGSVVSAAGVNLLILDGVSFLARPAA